MLAARATLLHTLSLEQGNPDLEFILSPCAYPHRRTQRRGDASTARENLTIRGDAARAAGWSSDARAALFHARASIVASGTATVEAALIGNPFVVVYRVSPVTYAIAKRVVTVPHVAMANLIAGKRVVPELIQNEFTAANIVQQLEPLLPDGPPRQSMMQELKRIRGSAEHRPGEAGRTGPAQLTGWRQLPLNARRRFPQSPNPCNPEPELEPCPKESRY